jgi:hypothetical protein
MISPPFKNQQLL